MQKFNVEFAKLNIEINCNYDFSKKFCADYLSDGAADFSVFVSEDDIDREIEVSPYSPKRGYAESICVYREIAKQLPLFDRLLFHGAVISCGGDGFLFTAPSGTGKTTHISLWKKFVDGVEVVNGDKPILHITDGGVTAYSTPYAGKEGYQNHSSIPLKAICLIHRGTENKIRRVKVGEVMSEMLNQIYMPNFDEQLTIKTLELLDKLFRTIPVYLLECDISENAVKCSFEALTGKSY